MEILVQGLCWVVHELLQVVRLECLSKLWPGKICEAEISAERKDRWVSVLIDNNSTPSKQKEEASNSHPLIDTVQIALIL